MSARRPRSEAELVEYLGQLDTPAPAGLRARVAALGAPQPRTQSARRFAPALAACVATLVAIAVIIASSGAGTSAPTVESVASLGGLPATEAPPARDASDPSTLGRTVDGIAFPYWSGAGPRAVGARTDTVGGRTATTVYYRASGGRLVAYTILAGTPAPAITGGAVTWSKGIEYRLLSSAGRHVIAWTERGRLCVISVRGALPSALRRELTS